jgi:hypothetical protein
MPPWDFPCSSPTAGWAATPFRERNPIRLGCSLALSLLPEGSQIEDKVADVGFGELPIGPLGSHGARGQ